MKRIMFLLCVIIMVSGCVPKASQFSLDNKIRQIREASIKRGEALAEQTRAIARETLTPNQFDTVAKSTIVTPSEAQGDAEKERERARAECMVKAYTSFAVMLADIISILSGEVLWGDLASKLATTTFNQTTFSDPLKLRTTKEVVNTCLKSKGFPPDEENDVSEPPVSSPKPTPGNPILKDK